MCERFTKDEFCNLCASYIIEKNRIDIVEDIEKMYLSAYGFEINLDIYAPSSICRPCFNSLKKFVIGECNKPRIKVPAKWGDFHGDHRDCFFHLVKVNLKTNKTFLPKNATYLPPLYN